MGSIYNMYIIVLICIFILQIKLTAMCFSPDEEGIDNESFDSQLANVKAFTLSIYPYSMHHYIAPKVSPSHLVS